MIRSCLLGGLLVAALGAGEGTPTAGSRYAAEDALAQRLLNQDPTAWKRALADSPSELPIAKAVPLLVQSLQRWENQRDPNALALAGELVGRLDVSDGKAPQAASRLIERFFSHPLATETRALLELDLALKCRAARSPGLSPFKGTLDPDPGQEFADEVRARGRTYVAWIAPFFAGVYSQSVGAKPELAGRPEPPHGELVRHVVAQADGSEKVVRGPDREPASADRQNAYAVALSAYEAVRADWYHHVRPYYETRWLGWTDFEWPFWMSYSKGDAQLRAAGREMLEKAGFPPIDIKRMMAILDQPLSLKTQRPPHPAEAAVPVAPKP